MNFDWGIFKRHPYISAAGGLVLFVLFYLYLRSSSSGSSAGSSAAAAGGTTAADVQLAQLQAAQNAQNLQAQTQVQVAGIQAGVAQQQIAAQKDVTDQQTAAALAAIQAQVTGQTTIAQAQEATNQASINAQVQENQALAGIVTSQYANQTAQQKAAMDYLTAVNNNQAGVAALSIAANQAVQTTALNNQYNLNQTAINNIKNVGGSQNRTAILLSATGNVQASTAAAQGQTISSMSGDTMLSNMATAATNAMSHVMSTLF